MSNGQVKEHTEVIRQGGINHADIENDKFLCNEQVQGGATHILNQTKGFKDRVELFYTSVIDRAEGNFWYTNNLEKI